jgi:hypothetical protein
MIEPPDHEFLYADLREQLNDAIDTVMKLREQGDLVRNRLLFLVDQGDGLTQDQLLAVYTQIAKLFPRRVRRASAESLDA